MFMKGANKCGQHYMHRKLHLQNMSFVFRCKMNDNIVEEMY